MRECGGCGGCLDAGCLDGLLMAPSLISVETPTTVRSLLGGLGLEAASLSGRPRPSRLPSLDKDAARTVSSSKLSAIRPPSFLPSLRPGPFCLTITCDSFCILSPPFDFLHRHRHWHQFPSRTSSPSPSLSSINYLHPIRLPRSQPCSSRVRAAEITTASFDEVTHFNTLATGTGTRSGTGTKAASLGNLGPLPGWKADQHEQGGRPKTKDKQDTEF